MEKDSSSPYDTSDEVDKHHRAKNAVYTGLIAVAALSASYGLKKSYDFWQSRKQITEIPSDEQNSAMAIEEAAEKTHPDSPITKFTHNFASSLFHRDKESDNKSSLRRISRVLQPIGETTDHLKDKEDFIKEMIDNGEDEQAARRLHGRAELMVRMIPDGLKREARFQLEKKFDAVDPNERQWPKIESIVNQHWGFDSLRRQRLLIKPGAPINQRGVEEGKGWLAILDRNDREVVGYGSFFAVEKIVTDNPEDENYVELSRITWQELLDRRVRMQTNNDLAGKTIIITSVGKDSKIEGDEIVGAALFGIIDKARRFGASNVLGPSFSPFIATRQRSTKHGGKNYFDYWSAKNPRGTLADGWRSLLYLMTENHQELAFNPEFMAGSIDAKELLEIIAQQKGIKNLSEEKIADYLTQDQLQLRKIPVPFVKDQWPNWKYTVPAAWLSFYDRKNDDSEYLPEIYSLANL